jgi:hypothetical protein
MIKGGKTFVHRRYDTVSPAYTKSDQQNRPESSSEEADYKKCLDVRTAYSSNI